MVPQEHIDLARDTFEAYCAAVGGVNIAGGLIPAWSELGENVQRGWIASAKCAYSAGYRDADGGPAREPRFPLT